MDTVFRSAQIEVKEEKILEGKKGPVPSVVNDVEVPYLDSNNYLEGYFELGTQWKDQDASFYPEIEKIDGYIKEKIKSGEVANDQKEVKTFLKNMEKVTNLKNESRAVVKLEVLANYIEFLSKNDHLKSNLKRYAY